MAWAKVLQGLNAVFKKKRSISKKRKAVKKRQGYKTVNTPYGKKELSPKDQEIVKKLDYFDDLKSMKVHPYEGKKTIKPLVTVAPGSMVVPPKKNKKKKGK